MSILSRYIAINLVQGWLMVFLVLGTVFGLVGLIDELDRAHGNYGVVQIIQFTLMSLPTQLLDLAPVIVLLGTIVALAGMDRHNELTIICCSGVPVKALLKAVALPTAVLMIVLWALLEFITAPLFQEAQQMKAAARNDNPDRIPGGGVWSKHGNRFIHLGEMKKGRKPGDISLYRFDDQGRLLLALDAETARVSNDRRWHFQQVKQKQLENGELSSSRLQEVEIGNLWSKAELPTLSLTSQSMRLSVLRDYSLYLRENGQAYEAYEMTFWQRLTLPITVAAMILLATPVSAGVGSRRNRNFGVNMGIGAIIGIFFFLVTQIIYSVGQMLQASPVLTTLAPAGTVILCASYMLHKMRW
jgi:lipopolysaccharide export system permease protein